MEVFPGVFQLKVPIPNNPLGHLNSYLIRGDKGCLLIDAGWNTEDAFQALHGQLESLGLGFRDIAVVIVTHVHPDHYGLAGRIKQISPTRFAFHIWEKALIESRYVHFSELQRKIGHFLRRHGVPVDIADPLEKASLPALDFVTVAWPDEVLYGGENFAFGEFEFEVLWTPGHSPGHVCLYEPTKKILFSGDHVLPTITPNVSYHLQSGSNPLGDFINSLHQVQRLPVSLILPAHEDIFTDLAARVDEIIHHHEDRKQRILEALDRGPKTAYSIAKQLTWNVPGNKLLRLEALQQRFAVMETLSHLELLRMEGQVERASHDGVWWYGLCSPR
ncbi:MAG: MBL fold metallo-hydrolase [Chloroflexi bacterium]|nr:MBL fold metallo-hydrolase [Chloroflexota bacterium]